MKLLILFLLSSTAFAGNFTVYKTVSGCKYFIIEQGFDYVIADVWTCYRPNRGDTGSGNLNSYGFKDVQLDNSNCRLYIDDYSLTQSSALRKLADKCGE